MFLRSRDRTVAVSACAYLHTQVNCDCLCNEHEMCVRLSKTALFIISSIIVWRYGRVSATAINNPPSLVGSCTTIAQMRWIYLGSFNECIAFIACVDERRTWIWGFSRLVQLIATLGGAHISPSTLQTEQDNYRSCHKQLKNKSLCAVHLESACPDVHLRKPVQFETGRQCMCTLWASAGV